MLNTKGGKGCAARILLSKEQRDKCKLQEMIRKEAKANLDRLKFEAK